MPKVGQSIKGEGWGEGWEMFERKKIDLRKKNRL